MRSVVPRMKTLPEDASDLGCMYGHELNAPTVGTAVESFLRQVSTIAGVHGVALGISRQEQHPVSFVVYALADLSTLLDEGSAVRRTPTAVREAFLPVRQAAFKVGPGIDPTLHVLNSHGTQLDELAPLIEHGELDDALEILDLDVPPLEDFCLVAVTR